MKRPVRSDEVDFLAVSAPGREGAARLRNLPPARAAGKMGYVNLFASGIRRTVGQPPTVRREPELNDSAEGRLSLHDGERFLFTSGWQTPHPGSGRACLFHVD